MTNITHLIYDLDGLLLDTEPFYSQAAQMIASRFGKIYDWTTKAKILGRPAMVSAKILVDTLQIPLSPSEYLEERNRLLAQLFTQATHLPGVLSLTQRFNKLRVPQAIATSSSHAMFELKTAHHQSWLENFQIIVKGDDPEVRQGKPAPDIFLVAARRLQAKPENCLVFEDAPSGLAAAKAAGMKVVVVPDAHMDKTLFQDADDILESLENFDPSGWGLP